MEPTRLQEKITKAFAGKTIRSIDAFASNSWTFNFADGSSATIDTFHLGSGLYGPLLVSAKDSLGKEAE